MSTLPPRLSMDALGRTLDGGSPLPPAARPRLKPNWVVEIERARARSWPTRGGLPYKVLRTAALHLMLSTTEAGDEELYGTVGPSVAADPAYAQVKEGLKRRTWPGSTGARGVRVGCRCCYSCALLGPPRRRLALPTAAERAPTLDGLARRALLRDPRAARRAAAVTVTVCNIGAWEAWRTRSMPARLPERDRRAQRPGATSYWHLLVGRVFDTVRRVVATIPDRHGRRLVQTPVQWIPHAPTCALKRGCSGFRAGRAGGDVYAMQVYAVY